MLPSLDGPGPKVLGIGVDLIEVVRFRSMDRRTMEHFLSVPAIEAALAREEPAPTLAGRFAAKEAVIKAVRSSLLDLQVSFLDIFVDHTPEAAPRVSLPDLQAGNYQILLSISHTKDHAIAFAVVVRNDDRHG